MNFRAWKVEGSYVGGRGLMNSIGIKVARGRDLDEAAKGWDTHGG